MLTFAPIAPEQPFITIRPTEFWSMLARDAIGRVTSFPDTLEVGSEPYKVEGRAIVAAQFLLSNALAFGQIHALVSPGNDGVLFRVPQEHWQLDSPLIEGKLSDELFCWDNSKVPTRFHGAPVFFLASDYDNFSKSAAEAIKESLSEIVAANINNAWLETDRAVNDIDASFLKAHGGGKSVSHLVEIKNLIVDRISEAFERIDKQNILCENPLKFFLARTLFLQMFDYVDRRSMRAGHRIKGMEKDVGELQKVGWQQIQARLALWPTKPSGFLEDLPSIKPEFSGRFAKYLSEMWDRVNSGEFNTLNAAANYYAAVAIEDNATRSVAAESVRQMLNRDYNKQTK